MEILELEVEKLVYEGAGLCRHLGKAVFVKGVLPGEIIKAKVVSKNKNFIRGELVEILRPSEMRIKPFCPLGKVCGGCDFIFAEYNYQTQIKEEIVKEIFGGFDNLEILPFIKSPKNLNYRCKTQYPVSQTRASKRILAGYYKENTHEIVNIKFCPIQPGIIDEVVQFVRENWKFGCYIEKTNKGLLRHINTRVSNSKGEVLITFVLNAGLEEFNKIKGPLVEFAELIQGKFPFIKGTFVNLNPNKTNKITGDKTILLSGEDFIIETLKSDFGGREFSYKTGPDSFFQVNPSCASLLFDSAKKLINKKGALLDLYGGTGAIGIFMSDAATKITLVEENKEAVKFAKENFKLNGVLKYEVYEGLAKAKMQDFIKEKRKFENVFIDPPRKGSDKETLENISKMTDSIIYISCNPMTLKRDANVLIQNGFEFKSVQGADMFPNTHHIECVAKFQKAGVV